MKVRLKQDLFQTTVYDLEVTAEAVVLTSPDGEEKSIPFTSICSFAAEGTGEDRKHFTMETEESLYEGTFLQKGDAEFLYRLLCEKKKNYVYIRLESEP